MCQLRTDYLFKALDHLGYLVLFLIGYFFIYDGNVIEKFQQKKTNFAAAVENVIMGCINQVHLNYRGKASTDNV